MQKHNWKKTSDFFSLLETIRDSEGECVISIGKNVAVGWFHVAIIRMMYADKTPLFVVRDERIRKLLKQSGFKVFQTVHDIHRFLPEGFQIMQANLSVSEYVVFHISRFFGRFFGYAKNLRSTHTALFEVRHSSWYVLVLGIIVVLLLMIGIVSLTTPHASVIITPQTSIQSAIRNVVFVPQDQLGAPDQIPLQKDIFSFELKKTYRVNTFDALSLSRAHGKVRILNSGLEELRLKPQTRIVSGALVFRIEKWADVPPAIDSRPGEAIVDVLADPVGSDGVLIGKKGNLTQNTSLTIPGLNQKDHENIVVVAHENFTGGDDTQAPLLTQEEYDRIEKIFKEQMIGDAQNYESKHYDKKTDFIPLPIPDALTVLDVSDSADAQVGAKVAEITFSGKANFMVYLYHQPTLRKILLETAKNHLLENTESLIEISDSPPDIIAMLTKTDEPFSIKATAEIPVQILYDFSSSTGQKTLQNILSDLLDADAERAQKTLLNHPYIKEVDIRLTPFWSNKLPSTLDKIYIKIEKTNT